MTKLSDRSGFRINTDIRRNGYRFDAGQWVRQAEVEWSYTALDLEQRRIQAKGQERFLISELAPVVTVGKRTAPTDFVATPADFKNKGVEVLPVDRGGMATYHGPGQWVFFPVAKLENLVGDRKGVRKSVEGLLEIAAVVARKYIDGVRVSTSPVAGVWSPRGKIASVGIRIVDGYILHGLSINAYRTPESFFGFRPCGMDANVDYVLSDCTESELSKTFENMGLEIDQAAREIFHVSSN